LILHSELFTNIGDAMQNLLWVTIVLALSSQALAQEIGAENTVTVPSNGAAGGASPSVWKAQCAQGMVMTGIEIVVGGTCRNQCNADGRPLAAYRIFCSQLTGGKGIKMRDTQN
jgi:hypothetical protein